MSTSASRQEPNRIGQDGAERISAAAYGLLVAASTLFGLGNRSALTIVGVVMITNVVFYATHVFAYSIGPSDTPVGWPSIEHHLRVSAPMLSAAFAPLATTLVALAFGAETSTATLVGVVTATVLLSGVAVVGSVLRGIRGWPLVLIAAGTLIMAAVLILAKVLVLH